MDSNPAVRNKLLFLTVINWRSYLLVVELHIELTDEGQRASPQQSPKGEEDRAVVLQEVEQILLSMEGTHRSIWQMRSTGESEWNSSVTKHNFHVVWYIRGSLIGNVPFH